MHGQNFTVSIWYSYSGCSWKKYFSALRKRIASGREIQIDGRFLESGRRWVTRQKVDGWGVEGTPPVHPKVNRVKDTEGSPGLDNPSFADLLCKQLDAAEIWLLIRSFFPSSPTRRAFPNWKMIRRMQITANQEESAGHAPGKIE